LIIVNIHIYQTNLADVADSAVATMY
jgi:hypothetical protein